MTGIILYYTFIAGSIHARKQLFCSRLQVRIYFYRRENYIIIIIIQYRWWWRRRWRGDVTRCSRIKMEGIEKQNRTKKKQGLSCRNIASFTTRRRAAGNPVGNYTSVFPQIWHFIYERIFLYACILYRYLFRPVNFCRTHKSVCTCIQTIRMRNRTLSVASLVCTLACVPRNARRKLGRGCPGRERARAHALP